MNALHVATIGVGLDHLRKSPKPDPKGFLFKLPSGESIRGALLGWFRKQLKFILGALPTIGHPLPPSIPDLYQYDAPMRHSMTPLISAYWDQAGKTVMARLGLDPDEWKVTNPHVREMIEKAALAFCDSTNRTTSLELNTALDQLRQQMHEGIIDHGEGIPELTKRVESVFDLAEEWRARRIAQTEAARAVHGAQEQAAIKSGVVQGFKWLLSSDACPTCAYIGDHVKQVPIGRPFAKIGGNAYYSTIMYPPAHPHCMCSVTEVLSPEYGGPEDPEWGQTATNL